MQTEDFFAKFVPLLPLIIPQTILLLTQNIYYPINPLFTLLSLAKTYIIRSFKFLLVLS